MRYTEAIQLVLTRQPEKVTAEELQSLELLLTAFPSSIAESVGGKENLDDYLQRARDAMGTQVRHDRVAETDKPVPRRWLDANVVMTIVTLLLLGVFVTWMTIHYREITPESPLLFSEENCPPFVEDALSVATAARVEVEVAQADQQASAEEESGESDQGLDLWVGLRKDFDASVKVCIDALEKTQKRWDAYLASAKRKQRDQAKDEVAALNKDSAERNVRVEPNKPLQPSSKTFERLRIIMSGEDSPTKLEAIAAIGKISDPKATALLIAATKEPERNLAHHAAIQLTKRSDDASFKWAVATINSDVEIHIRHLAGDRIAQSPSPDAIEELKKAVLGRDHRLRQQAARTLTKIEGERSTAALAGMLKGKDQNLARIAFQSLQRRQGDASQKAIFDALDGKTHINIRRTIVRWIEQVPTASAVDALSKTLSDKDRSLQQPVLRALNKIDGEQSSAVIAKALFSKKTSIARTAARFLLTRQDQISQDAMIDAINGHRDVAIRRMAIQRFERLPSPQAVNALNKALDDRKLKHHAKKALEKIRILEAKSDE